MPSRVLTLAALAPLLLLAQTAPPSPTMKQLMLDLIHPASNDIFLAVSRGGPASENDWSSLRHSALTLEQSAQTLLRAGPQSEKWSRAAKLLSDAASDAYRAAQAKDTRALPRSPRALTPLAPRATPSSAPAPSLLLKDVSNDFDFIGSYSFSSVAKSFDLKEACKCLTRAAISSKPQALR